ncbi:MAG: Xaa-Pro dipeptidase [Chloroflexota bacterium]|nr:Xaa-Pro dipeptidase [Chloroflexota bacterium]
MAMNRLERVCALMQDQKIPALAINAGSDLKYLNNLDFHLSERPAILILTDKGESAFIFPEFEQDKAAQSSIPSKRFPYPEDPQLWPAVAGQALESLGLSAGSLAVSPTSMRFLEMNLLQSGAPKLQIISGADIFRDIFIQKDEEEIVATRKAVAIAQEALLKTLPHVQIGKSEHEIANLLVINLLQAGSEPELAFSPIIASGPNAANPHANPGGRELQDGDMLIIDWGARYNGYVSDITRSFAIGHIPDGFHEIAKIVLNANQTARGLVKPGLKASAVDSAARDVISAAGYGQNFLHRTGHGIGLNAHEDPYISQASTTTLAPSMLFTVEPGIYLTGKGGIRIEDNVVVTQNGVETLTSLPRDIVIL